MAGVFEPDDSRFDVRELVRRGQLTALVQKLTDDDRRLVRAKTHEIVWPVVFQHLTRRLEKNRGHHACASGVHRLEPACLDRFHDDVDAAVDDLLRNAKMPIFNLEGWVSKRLKVSTVDAYRRRRGERGALQRPRLPRWLIDALSGEPRLIRLALDMLEWVGVDANAAAHVWPITTWAERRAATTHDFDAAYREVTADVETVVAAMRRRPQWYDDYVERPLARKQLPVLSSPRDDQDLAGESWSAVQTRQDEAGDSRLGELASVAIEAILARLRLGEDPERVVREVVTTAFGAGSGAEELDRRPGHGAHDEEQVSVALADPAVIEHIVALVQSLIEGDQP